MAENVVKIKYTARAYLKEHLHNDTWKRLFMLVHRRGGKTVAACVEMLRRAYNGAEDGQYLFWSPETGQGIRNVGIYFEKYGSEFIKKFDRQRNTIYLHNGAKIFFGGSRTAEALRGSYLNGCIMDEASQAPDHIYGEIVKYALMDRDGWCVFMGTARADDNYKLYNMYKILKNDPAWTCIKAGAGDTNVFSKEKLEEEWNDIKNYYLSRGRTIAEAQLCWDIEMLCNFESIEQAKPVLGAVLSNELEYIHTQGKVMSMDQIRKLSDYSPSQIKIAAFDLGMSNYTCYWMFQETAERVIVLGCYFNHDQIITHYIDRLDSEGIKDVVLPHDASQRLVDKPLTKRDLFRQRKLNVNQLKRLAKSDQEECAKRVMIRCVFSLECMDGLRILAQYAKQFNKDTGKYDLPPKKHDVKTDVFDGFCYMSQFVERKSYKKYLASQFKNVYNGDIAGQQSPQSFSGSDFLMGNIN